MYSETHVYMYVCIVCTITPELRNSITNSCIDILLFLQEIENGMYMGTTPEGCTITHCQMATRTQCASIDCIDSVTGMAHGCIPHQPSMLYKNGVDFQAQLVFFSAIKAVIDAFCACFILTCMHMCL